MAYLCFIVSQRFLSLRSRIIVLYATLGSALSQSRPGLEYVLQYNTSSVITGMRGAADGRQPSAAKAPGVA